MGVGGVSGGGGAGVGGGNGRGLTRMGVGGEMEKGVSGGRNG